MYAHMNILQSILTLLNYILYSFDEDVLNLFANMETTYHNLNITTLLQGENYYYYYYYIHCASIIIIVYDVNEIYNYHTSCNSFIHNHHGSIICFIIIVMHMTIINNNKAHII